MAVWCSVEIRNRFETNGNDGDVQKNHQTKMQQLIEMKRKQECKTGRWIEWLLLNYYYDDEKWKKHIQNEIVFV